MYLGVHYFSDVVAGYAAGGVWLSALITGAETMRRGSKKPRHSNATHICTSFGGFTSIP
jgi:membrane-associated phospholipid phosphatase